MGRTNVQGKERCGPSDTTPRDRRNLRRLLGLLAGWAVAFVGGAALLEAGRVSAGALAWGVAALPGALTVVVLIAWARYLREADELQRLIQLEALALGFGGGWFTIAGYRLFELLGAPRVDRGDVILLMVGFYTVGVLLGQRRYR